MNSQEGDSPPTWRVGWGALHHEKTGLLQNVIQGLRIGGFLWTQ